MRQSCVGTMGVPQYFGDQRVGFPNVVGQIDCTTSRQEAVRIRRIIKARRARAIFFNQDLFADPAWDLLLELYVAELTHRPMSVSDACLAAAVPPTTALRWIGALERQGLVRRRKDHLDGRRIFLTLSEVATHAMERLFATVGEACPI